MNTIIKNKLTTQVYWETYYKNNHANKRHIIKVCSYYDRFWEQLFNKDSNGQTIIEIGGFPGRYLAYLSSKYYLVPTCLDYNSDVNQIEASSFNNGYSRLQHSERRFY